MLLHFEEKKCFGNILDYFFWYLFVAKSKRKCKPKEDSSSITVRRENFQFASSQHSPMEEHENVLQGQQKNGTENESKRVTLVSESPTEKKNVMLPECSHLREESEMPDCQIARTSEDAGSNGK